MVRDEIRSQFNGSPRLTNSENAMTSSSGCPARNDVVPMVGSRPALKMTICVNADLSSGLVNVAIETAK